MDEINSRMKEHLSEFVDLLQESQITEEMKQIKRDLRHEISELRHELRSIQDTYMNEKKQLEKLYADVHTCVHSSADNKNRLSTVETNQKSIHSGIEDMVEKVATIVENQQTNTEEQLEDLAERVHHNEEVLFLTRDDHETITMLLDNFASNISKIKKEDKAPITRKDYKTTTILAQSAEELLSEHTTTPLRPSQIIDNLIEKDEETHTETIKEPPTFQIAPKDSEAMESLDNMFIV